MSKRSLSIILFFGVILTMAFGVGGASAASVSFSGTLTPGADPVMDVVFIADPNCTGQGTEDVMYHLYPFTVDASGTYDFMLTSSSGFASMYVFESSFDPANGYATCIAGANDDPAIFSVALTTGTQYYFVPFDDTFDQFGGDYSVTISGPGNIFIVGLGADCPYPLPVGSVVYDIPAGAPAFFAADLGSGTGFNIPAGTWYISEFSDDFAKVWIACQASPVWVPANAVGAQVG